MKKFDVLTVYQSLEAKYKKAGKKLSLKDEFHNIINKIDETDELLSLKIERGDPKIIVGKSGRRAHPGFEQYGVFRPTDENEEEPLQTLWDPQYVRYRLNELMKQIIYSTRNKMVGMQLIREEFKNESLYKMGFLMSKTDEAVKNYIRFTFRTYKACTRRLLSEATRRHQLIDILTTQERMLFKWFHIDLLTDLIRENDDNAREIMANYSTGRKVAWKFVD
ncbi:uncharacterized protein LOC128678964 isoform X2 [Plodia interpunctella]|nr:uncharacterized protein LOC128678964 isoform X2 [Plodia interpunctella]